MELPTGCMKVSAADGFLAMLEKVTFPRNRKIGHLSIDFPTLCASKTPIYAATESSFFFSNLSGIFNAFFGLVTMKCSGFVRG